MNIFCLTNKLSEPNDSGFLSQKPDPEPFSTESLEAGRGCSNFFQAVGELYSSENPFTITKIDFGIEGMGIDTSTIRLLQGEESGFIGNSADFVKKEENKIYLETDVLESLPSQDISLFVTESKFSIYASIRTTNEYNTVLTCLYIAPVYYCVDDMTKETFVYGSEMNYFITQPILTYEEEYEYIIQEKGI
ncbi:MAG: hypothetical protein ACI4C1_07940 [Lachnospiraceae bacterium]